GQGDGEVAEFDAALGGRHAHRRGDRPAAALLGRRCRAVAARDATGLPALARHAIAYHSRRHLLPQAYGCRRGGRLVVAPAVGGGEGAQVTGGGELVERGGHVFTLRAPTTATTSTGGE